MLKEFFESQLEELSEETNLEHISFQQDRPTSHTAMISMGEIEANVPPVPHLCEG